MTKKINGKKATKIAGFSKYELTNKGIKSLTTARTEEQKLTDQLKEVRENIKCRQDMVVNYEMKLAIEQDALNAELRKECDIKEQLIEKLK